VLLLFWGATRKVIHPGSTCSIHQFHPKNMTSDKTLGIFRSAEERVVWASRAQPSPFALKWNVWNFAVKWRALERQGLVWGHVWYCHLRLHDKYLEIFGYHMFASRRGAKLQDWLSYGIRIRTVLVEAIRPQTIPKADPLAIYIYILYIMYNYISLYICVCLYIYTYMYYKNYMYKQAHAETASKWH